MNPIPRPRLSIRPLGRNSGYTAKENQVTKTALITVGGFLSGQYERSKLYDPGFTHGYRVGNES